MNADFIFNLRSSVKAVKRFMTTLDYNGTGFWSFQAVLERYDSYIRRYKVLSPSDIQPPIYTEGAIQRIYPIMGKVIECIEKNYLACIEIGVEFIEESGSFPFGRMLKHNTARALRRVSSSLNNEQKDRIRKRIFEMIRAGYLPREFRQYAKLARKIGLADWQTKIEQEAKLKNSWAEHYYKIMSADLTEQ